MKMQSLIDGEHLYVLTYNEMIHFPSTSRTDKIGENYGTNNIITI